MLSIEILRKIKGLVCQFVATSNVRLTTHHALVCFYFSQFASKV